MLRKTRKAVAEVVAAVTEDPAERLQRRLADAQNAVAAARTAFDEAALEAELAEAEAAPVAAKRKQAAADALAQAQARLADLRGALQAHAGREAQRQEREAQADISRRRALVLQHVAERQAAVEKCEQAMADLVAARDALLATSEGIRTAWPHKKMDTAAMLLLPADLDMALRLALVKAGIAWAGPQLPMGRDAMPTLAQRIGNANGEATMRLEPAGRDAA